ncbi:hypothetical protein HMPREF1580_00616 [Gardnerella vaginalis JCP8070]|nr:hypothetical protein HMPREF1580_00616 [Gardnerella vaginalis JCP8070]
MFSRLCTRFKPNMVQKAEIALARISYAEKQKRQGIRETTKTLPHSKRIRD